MNGYQGRTYTTLMEEETRSQPFAAILLLDTHTALPPHTQLSRQDPTDIHTIYIRFLLSIWSLYQRTDSIPAQFSSSYSWFKYVPHSGGEGRIQKEFGN